MDAICTPLATSLENKPETGRPCRMQRCLGIIPASMAGLDIMVPHIDSDSGSLHVIFRLVHVGHRRKTVAGQDPARWIFPLARTEAVRRELKTTTRTAAPLRAGNAPNRGCRNGDWCNRKLPVRWVNRVASARELGAES